MAREFEFSGSVCGVIRLRGLSSERGNRDTVEISVVVILEECWVGVDCFLLLSCAMNESVFMEMQNYFLPKVCSSVLM